MMSPDCLTEESLVRSARFLAKRDRQLARILAVHGPPPMWSRRPGFATLVRIILEQQVSLTSAASMFARLKSNIEPFTPDRFVELGERHLKALGLTRQKTAYCLHLSEKLVEKRLQLAHLRKLSDEEAKATLMQLKGIGPWSADIYLLMALRRADIWPTSDLALATAVTSLNGLEHRPDDAELTRIAAAWKPFRAVAARMLWQYYLAGSRL